MDPEIESEMVTPNTGQRFLSSALLLLTASAHKQPPAPGARMRSC